MTSEQFEELKAIQEAYLEMANKRQEEEVFESERSEKYKTIVSSLDRMRAKAIANAELQKLQKQNKDHKKLPEEVELEESSYTPMHIKQAIGIANDKRYKGGNMTGAVTAIEKLHAGLSEHPKVKSALRTANESVEELEEGNFEKNMNIIKSGKLPPHIQAILDKRGAKGNDAIMAKGRAEKLKSIKEMLDEARAKKEPMEIYHPSYSSAVQHAKAHAEKQGYEISDDDWHSNVTMGPGKPSGGKTTRHVIPLHKDGKLSKKGLAIQVHDRQTDNKPYELNSYIN